MLKASQSTILNYAYNAMRAIPINSTKCNYFSDWLIDESGLECLAPFIERETRHASIPPNKWCECLSFIKSQSRATKKQSNLETHVLELSNFVQLSQPESETFKLSVLYKYDKRIESLIDCLKSHLNWGFVKIISALTNIPSHGIDKALSGRSKLISSGLCENISYRRPDELPDPINRLCNLLNLDTISPSSIFSALFGATSPPETKWKDFEHLGNDRHLLEMITAGAIRNKEKGINILLYGEPGTGKTEFCKVLAKRIGANLGVIGETDDDGDEPNRTDRLAELKLANSMTGKRPNTLLLMDEMEDIIPSQTSAFFSQFRGHSSVSKVYLNRLLENNLTPTFWTANQVFDRDPAFLRRMTFSVEFKKPPLNTRLKLWSRVAKRYNLNIDEAKLKHLAKHVDSSPSTIANAMKIGSKCGVDEKGLDRIIEATCKLSGHKLDIQASKEEAVFSTELLNTNVDLASLISKAQRPNFPKRVSFCLSGLPGTGKSEFARYFADAIELPVIQKRASDLIGMYVGQTEAEIAKAFKQAIDEEAILIFDEADSFLQSREKAQRSWEISMVNEMLTWMEKHPLPFFCTTNFSKSLDTASLRRFTFKIDFDAMLPEQNVVAFEKFFNLEAPSLLLSMSGLTPGDFANVKRRLQFLDNRDAQSIVSELQAELNCKPDAANPIGFSLH